MLDQRNENNGSIFTDFTITLVLFAVLYITSLSGFILPLNTILQKAIYPISQASREIWQFGKNEYATLLQARSLRKQVDTLTEENTQLRADLSQMIILKEENKHLHSQIQSNNQQSLDMISANIISTNPVFTIYAKDKIKLKSDQFVVTNNNVVGIVESAVDNIARVTLLKDLNKSVNVSILNNTKKEFVGRGMLQGEFGTNIIVTQITQDVKLDVGFSVVSNPDQNSEDTLHIGTISNIVKRESDLFQKIYVVQDINLDKISSVFVIVPKQ